MTGEHLSNGGESRSVKTGGTMAIGLGLRCLKTRERLSMAAWGRSDAPKVAAHGS